MAANYMQTIITIICYDSLIYSYTKFEKFDGPVVSVLGVRSWKLSNVLNGHS
jgi:hypothetical protein